MSERQLRVRIVLRRPPAGVPFALQHGAAKSGGGYPETVGARAGDGRRDLAFECALRVRPADAPGGAPRFLGPFVHGPPSGRFVYLAVGRRAGQPDSPWDRRVKVPLTGITSELLDAALADPDAVLEATLEGTLPDGSPVCATRPFVAGGGWAVRASRDESPSALSRPRA